VDAALEQLAKADTVDKVKTGLAAFNDAWNATVPEVVVGPGQFMTIYQPKVHGLDASGKGRVSFAKAWMS
jgi:hypothetical protein